MKIMADLDAVNLGLDENEADIAEELQDFDDSFDTRSEASESGSESSDSQPSISSVSSAPSSIGSGNRGKKQKQVKQEKVKDNKKTTAKRGASPVTGNSVNGKSGSTAASGKKKKISSAEGAVQKSPKKNPSSSAETDKNIRDKKSVKKARKKSTTSSNGAAVGNSANVAANTSGEKSDLSDIEDKPAQKSSSESESENSDSAANIKRNGRKSIVSPEKKSNAGTSGKSATNKNDQAGKSYDYMTKLNYLFRDTRFFLIKSNNADNIALAKSKNVWATLPQNDANLSQAFREARNVLLIFSVNESGKC